MSVAGSSMSIQPMRGPRLMPKRFDEKRPYGDGRNHEMRKTKTANARPQGRSVSYVASPVYQCIARMISASRATAKRQQQQRDEAESGGGGGATDGAGSPRAVEAAVGADVGPEHGLARHGGGGERAHVRAVG